LFSKKKHPFQLDTIQARLEESRTTIYQRDHTNIVSAQDENIACGILRGAEKKRAHSHLMCVCLRMRSVHVWDCKRPYNTVWSSPMKLCAFLPSSRNVECCKLIGRYRYTPPNTFVGAFHFTIALLPGGPSLLAHPPVWYKPELVRTGEGARGRRSQGTADEKAQRNEKAKEEGCSG